MNSSLSVLLVTGLAMHFCRSVEVRQANTLFLTKTLTSFIFQPTQRRAFMYRETVSTFCHAFSSRKTICTQSSSTCSFSETEAVPILALIIARYRVEVQNEPQFASETFEQRRERILTAETGITTT